MKKIIFFVLLLTVTAIAQEEKPKLKYNSMEDRWEYADPDDKLKYNYMEDSWEYADPDNKPEYNYMEDEWQFPKGRSKEEEDSLNTNINWRS